MHELFHIALVFLCYCFREVFQNIVEVYMSKHVKILAKKVLQTQSDCGYLSGPRSKYGFYSPRTSTNQNAGFLKVIAHTVIQEYFFIGRWGPT